MGRGGQPPQDVLWLLTSGESLYAQVSKAIAWVEGRLGPVRRRFFRSQLAQTEYLLHLRDNGQNYAVKTLRSIARKPHDGRAYNRGRRAAVYIALVYKS